MIEVEGLVRVLGDRRVLDGLDFTVSPGRVTGFLGPNGAGKTTTMRVLSTLLHPTEGSVRVCGMDTRKEADGVRRVIGLVTEEPGLLERLTVREQLTFSAQAYGLALAEIGNRISDLAELLGFTEKLDERAATLSKGNRQKVGLARALVHDPPVLLLDEPTANLDLLSQAAIQDLLRRPEVIRDKTVLLSTHAVDEADRVCEQVIGIVAGKVAATGTKDEIRVQAGAETFRDAFLALLASRAMESTPTTGDDGKAADGKAADGKADVAASPATKRRRFGRSRPAADANQ